MSQERILKALKRLGLSQTEADIYLFLANNGPQKTARIAADLRSKDQQLNVNLEKLRTIGVVNSTRDHSALFYALPFEKTLEILVKETLKRAQTVEQKKGKLLSEWRNLIEESETSKSVHKC
jgi:sugar-specific transcriptional regulator TrmB